MLVNKIKKKTDKVLLEYGRKFYSFGITPNFVTFLSMLFTLIAFYLFYKGYLFYGGLALLVDYLFDLGDGMIARSVGKTTNFGMYFDRITDMLRVFCWIPIALNGFISLNLAIWVMAVSFLASYAALYYELSSIKRIVWVPAAFWIFLFFAAITGYVYFFAMLGLVLESFVIVVNFFVIWYLNVLKK